MTSARKHVLIVDDDADLRQALAELVEAIDGRHVIGAADFAELVALGPRSLGCGLVILDVNLGPGKPSGLDALAWLRAQGFHGKAVFLTGHGRSSPQVRQAQNLNGVRVLGKPIAVDELLWLIESTA